MAVRDRHVQKVGGWDRENSLVSRATYDPSLLAAPLVALLGMLLLSNQVQAGAGKTILAYVYHPIETFCMQVVTRVSQIGCRGLP